MRTTESDRLSSPAGNRGKLLTPISPRAELDRSNGRLDAAELGGQPYLSPYVAAKAGLAGTTRNAAHAHRWDRIRINGLDIGWTDSEGEDATQRKFHGADDDWRAKAAALSLIHI